MPRKYTRERLIPIIEKSNQWADVCRTLGIKPCTGAQTHIKKIVVGFGISTVHFKGQGWSKGMRLPPRVSVEKYLKRGSITISSHSLKIRLIREGFKKAECEQCFISQWFEEDLPLELDHKNGNHFDNRLENLQILCPNCHSLKTRKQRKHSLDEIGDICGLELHASNSVGVQLS